MQKILLDPKMCSGCRGCFLWWVRREDGCISDALQGACGEVAGCTAARPLSAGANYVNPHPSGCVCVEATLSSHTVPKKSKRCPRAKSQTQHFFKIAPRSLFFLNGLALPPEVIRCSSRAL